MKGELMEPLTFGEILLATRDYTHVGRQHLADTTGIPVDVLRDLENDDPQAKTQLQANTEWKLALCKFFEVPLEFFIHPLSGGKYIKEGKTYDKWINEVRFAEIEEFVCRALMRHPELRRRSLENARSLD